MGYSVSLSQVTPGVRGSRGTSAPFSTFRLGETASIARRFPSMVVIPCGDGLMFVMSFGSPPDPPDGLGPPPPPPQAARVSRANAAAAPRVAVRTNRPSEEVMHRSLVVRTCRTLSPPLALACPGAVMSRLKDNPAQPARNQMVPQSFKIEGVARNGVRKSGRNHGAPPPGPLDPILRQAPYTAAFGLSASNRKRPRLPCEQVLGNVVRHRAGRDLVSAIDRAPCDGRIP